jgi:ribosome biogenesis protein UTP30
MNLQQQQKEERSGKKTLIGDNSDATDAEDIPIINEPVWLVLTTKRHIVDKNRLKPGKISVPHSLNTSPSLSVCLITADPQRAIKDVVSDPSFPSSLSSRITKIIGYSKLKARYQSFESRRQLLSEHDVFLADDRIIMRLVQTLGKIFYQSSKRPIPVRIADIERVDGKRIKRDQKKKSTNDNSPAAFASPQTVGKEIERTLGCIPVQLAPATTASIRVGAINLTPQQLSENVETVVNGMVEKFITKGWRNIKAIYIKGPSTTAVPVWLANELWLEKTDVLENDAEESKGSKRSRESKKRKSASDKAKPLGRDKNFKRPRLLEEEGEETTITDSRKEKLRKQKARALEDTESSK